MLPGSSGSSGTSATSGFWPFAPSLSLSLSTFFYLSLAFTTSVLAQDVRLRPTAASSSFPACGLTCPILAQADDSCTPPTAQVTNQQTYVSCFCQSDLLKNFRTTADGTCDDTCTSSDDRQLLQQWYVNFCSNGGDTESNPGTAEDSTSNTNSGNNNNSGNSNGTSSANSAADSSGSSGVSNGAGPQSWWDGHYQWVIMVIVLAVGFTVIAIVGVWLKRRHDKKHPNLYHATHGASDSRIFQSRNQDSLAPHARSVNAVSFASSSRTNVGPPNRQGPSPSPLQNSQGVDNGVEIREAPR
ncbi:hypothetical protein BDW75DRAFT_91747 [Aspergillus navahoensis]